MPPLILEIASLLIASIALVGIALGEIKPLRTNRAGIALAAAVALVAIGALKLDEAFTAIDLDTIALLLSMMILSAFLRFSGIFDLVASRLLGLSRGPKSLLAALILVSGIGSAIFLNDTMCLVLSPLVILICSRAQLNPLPYLIGVATSSNIGSMASIIGNPQNMLIGSSSGISFNRFLLMLGPPAALGLGIAFIVIVIAFPKDFHPSTALLRPSWRLNIAKGIMLKTLIASALLLILLVAGLRPAFAALAAASILLVTRRVKPGRIFSEIDGQLLIFFSGLFIITRAIRQTEHFQTAVDAILPYLVDKALPFSALSALLSNLVSNVPAVMLLSPLVDAFKDRERAWLLLAMSSTLAGNLTLLGSVANLIVAESARARGIRLGFMAYLRVGLPITILTLCVGTFYLIVI